MCLLYQLIHNYYISQGTIISTHGRPENTEFSYDEFMIQTKPTGTQHAASNILFLMRFIDIWPYFYHNPFLYFNSQYNGWPSSEIKDLSKIA